MIEQRFVKKIRITKSHQHGYQNYTIINDDITILFNTIASVSLDCIAVSDIYFLIYPFVFIFTANSINDVTVKRTKHVFNQ